MDNFLAELKRRHIYRVGAAYAVVAWLLLQLVNNVAPALRLPDWALGFVILLLLVGFPITLIFAWVHELKTLSNAAGAVVRVTAGKSDWVLFFALAVVVALIFYQQIAPILGAKSAQQQASGASLAQTPKPAGISVAVLPFVNLSSDKEQEFFSDGMTEEITSALAKVSGLNVVARTSAFQFKGANKDMRAIGEALGASHLIEGSVRKDGNEVRITAQLIRAGDGTHLWTESYDRELKGIFVVQEDIAMAIAASLSVPLGLKPGQTLVSNRIADTESYQDYLRARALVRAGRGGGGREPGGPLTQATRLLEQVVARDPNYAPAWGLLGLAYALIPTNTAARDSGPTDELPRIRAEFLQKADGAAQRAIRLDPNGIDGYLALASMQGSRHMHAEREDSFKQALSIDPGNPDALHAYANALAVLGRVKESLVLRLRLRAQEPLVPIFNGATAVILFENGRTDEAIAILKTGPVQGPQSTLAEAYASMGRYSDAVDALQRPAGSTSPEVLEEAMRLLRTAPAQTAAPQQTALSRTAFGFVYLFVGAPERALDYYEGLLDAGIPNAGESRLWAPDYAPVRKTERFKAHVRKAGLVDYWKARGWPQFCHPTTGDDFECN